MNKIILNYLFNTAYQLLVLILPFVTTPYIARVLGPEKLGVQAYSFSIIQILIILGMVGIPLYGSRQIAIYSNEQKEILSKEFWSIYIIQIIGVLLSLIVYLLYTFSLSEFWMKIFLLQSIHLLGAMLDISWLLMGLQRFKETVTRNFIFKILSIVLIFLFVKEEDDLSLYIFIISSTTFFSQLFLWISAKKYINFDLAFSFTKIKTHIKPILLIFLPQILGQLYLSVDKIILNFYRTETEVGYYDQAMKITKLVVTVVTSIGAVMLPNLSSEFEKGNQKKLIYYIEFILLFVLFLTIPMVVGLYSISDNFIGWFLGPGFAQVALILKVICPIILFIGLGSLFGIQILVSTNKSNKLTISILCGAIISIIFSLIFVPRYGIYATSIATVLAEGTVAIVQFFFVREFISLNKIYKSLLSYLIGAILMTILINLLDLVNVNLIIKTFFQIILGALIYLLTLFILKEQFIFRIIEQIFLFLSNKFIKKV